jgi:Glycosyl hydrolase family 26
MSRLRSLAVTAVGVAVVAGTAGTAAVLTGRHHTALGTGQPGAGPVQAAAAPVRVRLPVKPDSYLGVYESGVPHSYAPIETFARAAGRQPDLALYFSSWGDPFQTGFAGQAHARGTVPFIQMEPWTISLAAIAAGRSDTYLRSYARAVAAYRYPVLLGFGHEMNGNWYPWGWTHVPPAVWVAAWRHVVTVFRDAGARNATWIWTANVEGPGDGPLRAYWPGARYVNWVGITGYLYFPQDTFARVYRPTIAAVRRFTHRPILISETAVGQVSGQAAKIPGLFSLVRTRHLLGFVWFDEAQDNGVYHQDWRLEGHQPAVRVFRRALRSHFRS